MLRVRDGLITGYRLNADTLLLITQLGVGATAS
jgi:hypothetical protein